MEFSGRIPDWVAELRTRAPGRRDRRLRRALAGTRRARRRDARRLPGAGRADRSRRRRARRARCSSPSATCRRASACPAPALQLWAETDVFDEERQTHEKRRSATRTFLSDFRDLKIGDLDRPRRQRHRRLRRPEEDRGRARDAGVHGAPLRRRGQALRPGRAARSRPEIHRRLAPRARQAGRDDLGEGEDARQEGDARHGGGAAQALRLAQGHPRPRLQPRQPLAAGVRGRVRVGSDDRSAERRHRHQARHGIADADGSPAVRRRRLRQDRSRDARRVQGGHGRQAGRGPRADDRARVPAPEDAEGSLRRVPGPHRHGQPLPHQGGAEGDARRSRGRQGRDHRRHAPAAVEGRASSATSACSSSTRSSASASRTRSGSSSSRSASTS